MSVRPNFTDWVRRFDTPGVRWWIESLDVPGEVLKVERSFLAALAAIDWSGMLLFRQGYGYTQTLMDVMLAIQAHGHADIVLSNGTNRVTYRLTRMVGTAQTAQQRPYDFLVMALPLAVALLALLFRSEAALAISAVLAVVCFVWLLFRLNNTGGST